jgi:preprotein translocase subunit SecD
VRRRDINLLILTVLVTALALWINLTPRANPSDPNDRRELWLGRDVHTRYGLDLRGGTEVLLRATAADVTAEQLDIARRTIEQRVNGLGVAEATVQTSGSNRIIVELPDVANPEQALETIRSTGKLEFVDPAGQQLTDGQLVRTSGSPEPVVRRETASATGGVTATDTLTSTGALTETVTGPILQVIADGGELDLNSVQPGVGTDGKPYVAFTFTGESARTLEQFTASNVGNLMAIVLDNRVQSVATIQAALPGSGQISTNTVADRDSIYNVLKYGSLPVVFEVESSRSVTATLGQASINASLIAGIIGLASVAFFMIVYYRMPGVVAVVALLIYALISFAIYRLVPVTLTLPGIAAFILSIGLAVDANVLIFARTKEELRRGRPFAVAVEQGFDHAWPSIRDSNNATLITSIILYAFGSNFGVSIIKGFALTLALGVIISLFTANAVTRTLLRLVVRTGRFNRPSFFAVEDRPEPTSGANRPVMEA